MLLALRQPGPFARVLEAQAHCRRFEDSFQAVGSFTLAWSSFKEQGRGSLRRVLNR